MNYENVYFEKTYSCSIYFLDELILIKFSILSDLVELKTSSNIRFLFVKIYNRLESEKTFTLKSFHFISLVQIVAPFLCVIIMK